MYRCGVHAGILTGIKPSDAIEYNTGERDSRPRCRLVDDTKASAGRIAHAFAYDRDSTTGLWRCNLKTIDVGLPFERVRLLVEGLAPDSVAV